MLTLWDLLTPRRKQREKAAGESAHAPAAPTPTRRRAAGPGQTSMRARYVAMTAEMLAAYGVRVRRWRTSMTGCAWEVYYHDGRTTRLIEAPRPRGPMSAAVFLHEIGHHAIGFNRHKPRCLEEHYAWEFALAEMQRRGLNVTEAVLRRRGESLQYAIGKARRRGLKAVPALLAPWDTPLRSRRRPATPTGGR